MRHVQLPTVLFTVLLIGLLGSCSIPPPAPTSTPPAVPPAPGVITADNIAELSVRQTIATGFSRRVGFTADGRLLITGVGDQHVELRRMSDAALLQTLPGAPPWLDAEIMLGPAVPRISSGGSLLISADWRADLTIYRLSDGARLRGFSASNYSPLVTAFSPDEQLLALGADTQIELFRTDSWQSVQLIGPDDATAAETPSFRTIAFSPDGTLLAAIDDEGGITLWRVSDGSLVSTWPTDSEWPRNLVFSPDGTLLAATDQAIIRLWRISDGRQPAEWQSPETVNDLAFSPDSRLLVSGDDSGTLAVFDTTNRQQLRTLTEHTDRISSVAFSPDGLTLASGSVDLTVRLWRVSGPVTAAEPGNGTVPVAVGNVIVPDNVARLAAQHSLLGRAYDFVLTPDNDLIVGNNSRITRRRLSDLRVESDQPGPQEVWRLVFSPDGQLAVITTNGAAILVSRLSDGETVMQGDDEPMGSTPRFSPDSRLLATDSNTEIRLRRISDGTIVSTLRGHTDRLADLAWSTDGTLLASGSYDTTARLWRVSDGQELRRFDHIAGVSAVAISPDGTLLATATNGRRSEGTSTVTDLETSVRLWRISDGRLLQTMSVAAGELNDLAFSPDGQLLASCTQAGTIQLWQVNNGRLLRELDDHRDGVTDLAFSPDGRFLASSSYDQTVKLWQVLP